MHTIIWNSASFPTSGMVLTTTRHNGRRIFMPTRLPLIAQHRNVPRSASPMVGSNPQPTLRGDHRLPSQPGHPGVSEPWISRPRCFRICLGSLAFAGTGTGQQIRSKPEPISRSFCMLRKVSIKKALQEIFALDRMHALDDRTVLVHGLACTPEAVSLINQRRAAVILCPTSNEFLFHQSPSLALIRSLEQGDAGQRFAAHRCRRPAG